MYVINGRLARNPRGFLRGFTPIVDEEWDEFHAPALTTATCHAQFEGIGRNNFGCEIIEARNVEVFKALADERPPPPPPKDRTVSRPWWNPVIKPERLEPLPSPDVYQQVLSAALADRSSYFQGLSSDSPLLAALESAPVPTDQPNSVTPSAWREESERFRAWRRSLGVERERKRLELKEVEPLHVFCMNCGYRQGGPDSWDGQTCKCGERSEPLRGAGGGYFYGWKRSSDENA